MVVVVVVYYIVTILCSIVAPFGPLPLFTRKRQDKAARDAAASTNTRTNANPLRGTVCVCVQCVYVCVQCVRVHVLTQMLQVWMSLYTIEREGGEA